MVSYVVTDAFCESIGIASGKSAGFDFGLKTFLVDSVGNKYHAPLIMRTASKLIEKLSKKLFGKKEADDYSNLMTKQVPEVVITSCEKEEGVGVAMVDTETEKIQKEERNTCMLKNLNFEIKQGMKIKCYPTLEHCENGWKITAKVIGVEEEEGYFQGCTVEYVYRNEKKTARIPGGCPDWLLSDFGGVYV